jgi:hypothetical protein
MKDASVVELLGTSVFYFSLLDIIIKLLNTMGLEWYHGA